MPYSFKQTAVVSVACILAAIILFFCSGRQIPVVDSRADVYFSGAITKAGLAYAGCRVVNASVSIVKESNLQLEPAGVGVSLAVGQALDPIDDMAERLSNVLVIAITSLGVQKLAYEISQMFVPPLLAIFLGVFAVLLWFRNERVLRFRNIAMRIVIILVVARFCLPVSSMANEFLQKHFFDDRVSTATRNLALGSAELDRLKELSLPEFNGILDTIGNSAAFIKRNTVAFKNAIVTTVNNMGEIIQNLLELMFLYVGIFFIQVIALPFLTFWLLARLLNALFDNDIALVLKRNFAEKDNGARPLDAANGK
ncbi:MAG: hypothetical protein JXK94_13025 [Deltaproteobacteria bacterium]|nr:hypothetical protein [Deltaproteobacteria bacterium]